jgi:iron complex outermembrane receptor protein
MKLVSKQRPLAASVAAAVAMTAMLGSGSAFAQRAIEEVVITAERREATEQTTSISMEVFTGDDLRDNGIREVRDLQNAMPGIQIQDNGNGSDVNIRGVGTSVFSPDVQMGVQIVNDGLVHGEPMGLNGAFFDVGTIEVLRGPQGTFIGQSAAGGAILINSANPDFDGLHGYVDGTFGNYQHNSVEAALNLPISDTWAGRIAVLSEERESYYQNLGGQVIANNQQAWGPGQRNNRNVRVSLLWQPSDNFSATFKVMQSTLNDHGDPRVPTYKPLEIISLGTDGTIGTRQTYSQWREYTPGPNNPFQVYTNFRTWNLQENQQWSMFLDWQLPNGWVINTNTGYNKLFVQGTGGGGGNGNHSTAVPIYPDTFQLGPDNRSVTNEVTITSADDGSRGNWIVGAFKQQRVTPVMFQNPSSTNERCGWQPNGTHVNCGPLQVPTSWAHVLTPANVVNKSVFGQYTYDLTDELELAVGARWNIDDSWRFTEVISRVSEMSADNIAAGYSYENCVNYGLTGNQLSTPATMNGPTAGLTEVSQTMGCRRAVNALSDIQTKNVDTEVPTWKIGLNWSPTDDDFFYAFYARGYKAGTHQGTGVQPEQIDDYEFGWKGSLFDGAFSGDLNFYYMDYQDLQGTAWNGDETGMDTTNTNIGEATIKGVEASGQMFFGQLGINFSVAFSDSEVQGIRTLNEDGLPLWAENDLGGAFDWLPQCGVGTLTLYGDGNASTAATARVANPADATTTVPNGNCFDYNPYLLQIDGTPQVQAPELSYNIAIDYELPFGGGTLTPRLAFSHTDESWSSVFQQEYYRNDERDITDFTLAYDKDDWRLQFYVRNLGDETYIASARDGWIGYGAPRTYGVRARLNF